MQEYYALEDKFIIRQKTHSFHNYFVIINSISSKNP